VLCGVLEQFGGSGKDGSGLADFAGVPGVLLEDQVRQVLGGGLVVCGVPYAGPVNEHANRHLSGHVQQYVTFS
jgi:hypothetical protein